jgi:hypothetical protein
VDEGHRSMTAENSICGAEAYKNHFDTTIIFMQNFAGPN